MLKQTLYFQEDTIFAQYGSLNPFMTLFSIVAVEYEIASIKQLSNDFFFYLHTLGDLPGVYTLGRDTQAIWRAGFIVKRQLRQDSRKLDIYCHIHDKNNGYSVIYEWIMLLKAWFYCSSNIFCFWKLFTKVSLFCWHLKSYYTWNLACVTFCQKELLHAWLARAEGIINRIHAYNRIYISFTQSPTDRLDVHKCDIVLHTLSHIKERTHTSGF